MAFPVHDPHLPYFLVPFLCLILTVFFYLLVPMHLQQATSNVFGKIKFIWNKSIIIKHSLLLRNAQSSKNIRLKNIIDILYNEWRS